MWPNDLQCTIAARKKKNLSSHAVQKLNHLALIGMSSLSCGTALKQEDAACLLLPQLGHGVSMAGNRQQRMAPKPKTLLGETKYTHQFEWQGNQGLIQRHPAKNKIIWEFMDDTIYAFLKGRVMLDPLSFAPREMLRRYALARK
jgi:hypothetical protein